MSAFDVHDLVGARERVLAHAAVAYADRLGSGTSRADLEPFGPANAARVVEPTRAGAGAGPDRDAAVRDALGSALAFEALRAAIAGAPVSRVPLDSLADDPELLFLTRAAANLGFTVDLLDIGGHTLLARNSETKLWAIAADPSWREAAVRVLCDLVGRLQIGESDGRDPFLTDFDPDTLVATGTATPRADDSTWDDLGAGLDVVPIGGSDLPAHGLHVVRVVRRDRA